MQFMWPAIISTTIILIFNTPAIAKHNNVLEVDFIKASSNNNPRVLKLNNESLKYNDNFLIFQNNYEAKKPSKMVYNQDPLVPKVMHQIWIGGNSIPPLYENYLAECRKLHPDWEFKIWYDQDIENLNMQYKDSYQMSRSYAGKVDIARYEILYRFGGVYRDLDVKCIRPIDDLNHLYDFYASIEGPYMYRYPILNAGVIGASPKHKILLATLEYIKNNLAQDLKLLDQGINYPGAFKLSSGATIFHFFGVHGTMAPLTKAFVANVSLNDKSIALPPTYLIEAYPYISKYNHPKNLNNINGESLVWHNIGKNEISPYPNKQIIKYNKNIGRLLTAEQNQILKVFSDLYNHNNPDKANWSQTSKIPQVINFIVFDEQELATLQEKLPLWEMLNKSFEIKIWSKEMLRDYFKDSISNIAQLKPSEDLRFYLALKILNDFGGTYAKFNSLPHKPIFELNNKYSLYAGMMPVNNNATKILLSQKLIGFSKSNPILQEALAQISIDNLEKANEILTLTLYRNADLYGKKIILPAFYFEPIGEFDETLWQMMLRLVKNKPKPLSQITRYTVIE